MTSSRGTVGHLVDEMGGPAAVSARKMFGEYGLYCEGKLVALVCNGRLFVKPTEAGRRHVEEVAEVSPYPGARPCFLIPVERWDDAGWLGRLVRITAGELPLPVRKLGAGRG